MNSLFLSTARLATLALTATSSRMGKCWPQKAADVLPPQSQARDKQKGEKLSFSATMWLLARTSLGSNPRQARAFARTPTHRARFVSCKLQLLLLLLCCLQHAWRTQLRPSGTGAVAEVSSEGPGFLLLTESREREDIPGRVSSPSAPEGSSPVDQMRGCQANESCFWQTEVTRIERKGRA